METGGAARAVKHGRLQVVEDHGTRTTAEELEGMHQAAVELGLALRERELDEDQPAIAEHGHEHRNLAGRGHRSGTRPHSPQSTCIAWAGS